MEHLNKQEFQDTPASSISIFDSDVDLMEANISAWLLAASDTHAPLKKLK